MRLITALLIAALAGAGMGYCFGYNRTVENHRNAARPVLPQSYFDDYYADPATRPTTLPTSPPHRPGLAR